MSEIEKIQAFKDLDAKYQQDIVLEAMGKEISQKFFYESHGKKELSKKGIEFVIYWHGDVHACDPKDVLFETFTLNNEEFVSATTKAINTKYNVSALGTAECPVMHEVYDKDEKKKVIKFDTFCRRKALGMAQRNAFKSVIPTAIYQKWLEYFTAKDKGREVDRPFKPKIVDAEYEVLGEQKPPKEEKPKAKVGPPPRKTPPKKQPKKGNTTPQDPPKTIDELHYRLKESFPFLDEILVLSERPDFLRVGKKRTLDSEIENQVEFLINEFGGEWSRSDNCWKIMKE